MNNIKMNCCSLVSLKLHKGWTDLGNFGVDIFVKVQGRFTVKTVKKKVIRSSPGQVVFNNSVHLQDDEIEDLVGDVKLTESQKSVATSNVYSLDFTDSSSDKHNSSGKETYVIECDDSEDSDTFPLRGSESVVNLKDQCATPVHVRRDVTIQCESFNKTNKAASTTYNQCSIIAQEIFTQTSKTILELAETEGTFTRTIDQQTLETQTSFISITENKSVEYRIETSGTHTHFTRNVNNLGYELKNQMFQVEHNQTLSTFLEDESSKLPVSETDIDKTDDFTSGGSSDDKIRSITNGSKSNMFSEDQNDIRYENQSDYDESEFEDSLMETQPRKAEDDDSDSSDIPKSVDNDVEELYTKLSETIDLATLERPCDADVLRVNTLTPLTEESTVKKDSVVDITPNASNITEESDGETLFRNSGLKVKMLPVEEPMHKDNTFRLPPLQNSSHRSCPSSPHLNFLFSVNPARGISKSGTLPSLYEDQNSRPVDRWEIGTKDLASGESVFINGKRDPIQRTSETVHLPPIQIEGFVVHNSNRANVTTTNVVKESSPRDQTSINIKDKIKELKMNTKPKTIVRSRISIEASNSKSASPRSISPNEARLCDAAERGCEALCVELLKRLQANSWFDVVDSLDDIPKVLEKFWGIITEHRIADLIRQICGHVESPRSQVACAACSTLACILKNTNYTKKPDFYEAVTILLTKTGCFSRPVRRAANVALDDIVCGVELSHAVAAICVHGTGHKSPLVRCASARLLVVCCALAGGGRELLRARPPTAALARKHALRSLALLLEDKNTDARKYAERLYSMLRPLTNFEAYYLTDVDVELASRQMKKYDQLLLCGPPETR